MPLSVGKGTLTPTPKKRKHLMSGLMRNYGYACIWRFCILRINWKSIKWPWAEAFEMKVKIEQKSDFGVDNGRRLFDAQETKKVSKLTIVG